jgi:hypothetical protein
MELMGLVDKDDINVWSFATCDRLDATDLNGLIAIGALMDALHDAEAAKAFCLEGGDGLVNQADRRNREGYTVSLIQRALDDVRGQQGLPEAGWGLKHGTLMAAGQRPPQRL